MDRPTLLVILALVASESAAGCTARLLRHDQNVAAARAEEPVPGQAAIQIFLLGENPSEKFYYRVPLVGTVDEGYSPDGIYRGNGPYPPSVLRQPLGK